MLTRYHKFPCISWQVWAGLASRAGLASTHTSSHPWIQNVSLVRGWSRLASDHTLPLPCMLWQVPVGLASTNTASLACMLWWMWGGLDIHIISCYQVSCICFGGGGGWPRQCEYISTNPCQYCYGWWWAGMTNNTLNIVQTHSFSHYQLITSHLCMIKVSEIDCTQK